MNNKSSEISNLIRHFSKLPGLGPRSAQRITLHLLNRKESLQSLIQAAQSALDNISNCHECGNLDTCNPCSICTDPRRKTSQICVVEEVQDLWAIERSQCFSGLYHVLGGTLSAIEGRGPDKINLSSLLPRIEKYLVTEVILATNTTMEGQTTAHYITDILSAKSVNISRLAQGVPVGGELDFLDDGTLGMAMRLRLPALS